MRRARFLILLAGCLGASHPVRADLRVGIAKVKITPTQPVMPAGDASRNKPSEGVAAFRMSGSGWDTPFALGLEDRIISTVHQMLKD